MEQYIRNKKWQNLFIFFLFLSGCSTSIKDLELFKNKDDFYFYWQEMGKDRFCPYCGSKGNYQDSSITRKYFDSTSYHYYTCWEKHKWLIVEKNKGNKVFEDIIILTKE
jgi:hypothetical protein